MTDQISSPNYLPVPWCIALVAAFCVLVPLAGTVANEVVGGWFGGVIWFVAWGLMVLLAWILTCKYANPKLPLICGVMMGLTAPRPTDEWLRQVAGEWLGKAIDIAIAMICVAIGVTIFLAIAKRHQSPSAG